LIVDGSAKIEGRSKKEIEILRSEAKKVAEKGWRPAFWMIDKSLSELLALRRGVYSGPPISAIAHCEVRPVFPGIRVRLCQFHVIQALQRWVRDQQRKRRKKQKRKKRRKKGDVDHDFIALPKSAMAKLLDAVRTILQRCRDIEDDSWDDALIAFRAELERLCAEEGVPESALPIWEYFEENWFVETWRGLYPCLFAPLVGSPMSVSRNRFMD
jgi:hypothetical protein